MFMRILDRLEEIFISFLMAAATLITFAAVLHRYLAGVDFPIPGVQNWLLQQDLSWAQELTIILFVWMAKFGAAYGVRTGIHVGVDVLINRLEGRTRGRFVLFGLAAGAFFTGVVATMGAYFVWENGAHYAFYTALGWDVGQLTEGPTTPDMEMATWIVYSAIPLGSSLMCFRFLQVFVNFWRTGELPSHDHGHVAGVDREEGGHPTVGEEDRLFRTNDDMHPRPVSPAPSADSADQGDCK